MNSTRAQIIHNRQANKKHSYKRSGPGGLRPQLPRWLHDTAAGTMEQYPSMEAIGNFLGTKAANCNHFMKIGSLVNGRYRITAEPWINEINTKLI